MAQSSREVVTESVEAQRKAQQLSRDQTVADELFLTAICISRTHPDIVESIPGGNPMTTALDDVATFLRYAEAIDKALESLANTGFAAAVVFGCVRFMLSLAAKEMKLFMAIKTQFQEMNHRLRRIDLYLRSTRRTEAVTFMLCKVMADMIRFSGLATKYLKSGPH